MDNLKGLLTLILGFVLYALFTHPRYWKEKVPTVSIGRMQLLPNVKINFKNQTIHLHHWILLSTTLGFLNHIAQGIDHLFFVKFFTLGGILQGFAFKDRFQVIIPSEKTPAFMLEMKRILSKEKRTTAFRTWESINKQTVKDKLHSISVVIPAHNEAQRIKLALKSLKKQDYQGRFEVIVVDNNSTDDTTNIAKKFGAKVVFEPQKGAAHARQTGFMAAGSQIIATTDADSILPTNWLSSIANLFNRYPRAVMVSGMYEFYDATHALNFWTWLLNYPQFVIFGWYSGANMAVKRDAFIKIGGFNTSLPLSEDSNLGVRLRKIGKVYRTNSFKVKVSARRFNQLGFWGGLWDYSYNYIKFKLHISPRKVNFRSGSEVPKLGFWPKIAIHIIVAVAILAGLFGSALEIKPVKAQVIRRERQIQHQISKIDVDLPHISNFHYVRHK